MLFTQICQIEECVKFNDGKISNFFIHQQPNNLITLKRFLEGFLVRLTKSLTKNPSRNRISWILMGKMMTKNFAS